MEKKYALKYRRFRIVCAAAALLFFSEFPHAHSISKNQNDSHAGGNIRFELWALIDEEPSVQLPDLTGKNENTKTAPIDFPPVNDNFEEKLSDSVAVRDFSHDLLRGKNQDKYRVPIWKISELAPFILEGMVFGWDFDYSPSDKARGVSEYFAYKPWENISADDSRISFHEPIILDNKLRCYAEFFLSGSMRQRLSAWNSVVYPKIQGTGRGSVSAGIDGQKAACCDAVKQGVRQYVRQFVKNKPKEISGTVLFRSAPRMYISDGFYIADLDFFLYVGTIVPYTSY
ncbi:MAG: hypothetical protein NC041_00735 [Bacteroides sp.]|nr:hypothetical protein [Prevotella sp.]MCM1408003.1 hypothetical protein [Treponema brennaborense]MCM1468979.1 hypothetical protein [Bacteroides sp.]